MSQHCNPRSAATTWRYCQSCQSQDTAQMDETRQSEHSCCVLAAWRRMSQHCNPRSAATTWRYCHRCKSQDTAPMDETPQREHSRCVLAAWRRMSHPSPSTQQNASAKQPRSRVAVHLESRSASAQAARSNDLCTPQQAAATHRCS